MKVKLKKTRVNFLKDSQKLKYASLAGGNALAMTLFFYSLALLLNSLFFIFQERKFFVTIFVIIYTMAMFCHAF